MLKGNGFFRGYTSKFHRSIDYFNREGSHFIRCSHHHKLLIWLEGHFGPVWIIFQKASLDHNFLSIWWDSRKAVQLEFEDCRRLQCVCFDIICFLIPLYGDWYRHNTWTPPSPLLSRQLRREFSKQILSSWCHEIEEHALRITRTCTCRNALKKYTGCDTEWQLCQMPVASRVKGEV